MSCCVHSCCVLTLPTRFYMYSIAQYSPRLIVLILDGCRLFVSSKPLAEQKLNIPAGQKIKAVGDNLVAHACAANDEATDSGRDATDKDSIPRYVFVRCNPSNSSSVCCRGV